MHVSAHGLLSTPHKHQALSFHLLNQIHALFSTASHPSTHSLSFSKLHELRRVFDSDHASLISHLNDSLDVRRWDSLIGRFAASPKPQTSLHLYAAMRRNGVAPSHHTFPAIFKAFSKLRTQNPYGFHAHTIKFGLNSDNFVRNSLISAYANCRYVGRARHVFEETEYKDLISFTAMIDGFLRNGCAIQGLKCFVKMRSKGMIGDEVTVVSALAGAAMAGDIWFGRSVQGFYVETGRVKRDVYIGSCLVDMYAKCGFYDCARKVFDEMSVRNVVCWSAMISGYVQCERFKEALLVFQEMLAEDVKPNQQTLTSVLTACAQLGALQQGRWVESYVNQNFVGVNCATGTALVDMYAKSGCINEALRVFETLLEKNAYTWTAMINALAMHGDALGSLNLFSRMLSLGISPNEVTFIGVLSACSHGGLVDEGRELFRSMKEDYHLEPNADHFGCMVDLLGRAGCFNEAKDLIESMPMEPATGILGILFSACMNHKAFELGEHLGNRLVELQPSHSGAYALLANLYSAVGKWDKAAHTRKLMNEKWVRKTPGCSWIEVNGLISEFVALDISHRESNGLYKMLDFVSLQMKFNSYAQEISDLGFSFDAD